MKSALESPTATCLSVLATFDPTQLGDRSDPALAELLDWHTLEVQQPDGGTALMLSEAARVEAWAAALRSRGPKALYLARETTKCHFESALQEMLDNYIYDRDISVEERGEDQLSAMLHVRRWASTAHSLAKVEESSRPIDRDVVEGHLRLLQVLRPVNQLLQSAFVGRAPELARLHAFRNQRPSRSGLHSSPAFNLWGVGGMGKSMLVAKFLQETIEESAGGAQAWAYLDFDRPTLKPRTGTDSNYSRMMKTRELLVLEDIIEQVGAQHPDVRRYLEEASHRVEEAIKMRGLEADASYGDSDELIHEIGRALNNVLGDEPVTIVLDTFEEVERYGPEAGQELFRLFDALSHSAPTLRLIVSGRTAAEVFRHSDKYELHLAGLEPEAAREALSYFATGIPPSSAPDTATKTVSQATAEAVSELVGRSPLTLALAGRVLREEGLDAIENAALRASALGRIRDEFVRGFLYHRILDHVAPRDPELRANLASVARAAIVLRYVNADIVGAVLLPVVNVDGEPDRYFQALESEVALVLAHGDEGLQLRPELRRPALYALQLDDAAFVRKVRDTAASYFKRIGDTAECTYMRLARGRPVAEFSNDELESVVELLQNDYADLPEETGNALRGLRRAGASRGSLQEAREQLEWEQRVYSEADAALLALNLEEAEKLLEGHPEWSRTTNLHQLASRVAERRGNLVEAIDAQGLELEAAIASGNALRAASAGVRLAKLFEWNNQADDAVETLADVSRLDLLVSEWAIRLEVVLNLMAIGERLNAHSDDDRWQLELDARTLMSRVDAGVLRRNAMMRLMAAVFGREERRYIRLAIRAMGLDKEAPWPRVAELAARLLAWDQRLASNANIGPVAQALRVPSSSRTEDEWARYLSGLGDVASSVFGESFWLLEPPPAVLEALRQFFLYAGFDKPSHLGTTGATSDTHFLDQPLDFSTKPAAELESIVGAAYKDQSELHSLMAQTGLDQREVDWNARSQHVVRQILELAQAEHEVGKLIAVVLADEGKELAVSLRNLIGNAWLERRGLSRGSAGLARFYARWYQQATGTTATWLPLTAQYSLGDYGTLRRGQFQLLGNIRDFGLDATKERDVELANLSLGTVTPMRTHEEAVPGEVHFSLSEGMLVRAYGVTAAEISLESVRKVAEALPERRDPTGQKWRLGWYVVRSVYQSENALVAITGDPTIPVVASGGDAAIREFATGGLPNGLSLSVAQRAGKSLVAQTSQSFVFRGPGVIALDLFRVGVRGRIVFT